MDCGGEIVHIRRFFWAAAAAVLLVGLFKIGASTAESAEAPPANFVAVYYFHGNFRCVNCRNIEQYTKEAVNEYFKKELDAGKVVFKAINVETKGNERFTNDYGLYTKSVILSLLKNGKEVKFTNLTKIWEYLRSKEAFHQYIKNEIEKYLKEL
jgi:thiol-disulfide isomerase/thioredoxin